jgi:hypothetical protein
MVTEAFAAIETGLVGVTAAPLALHLPLLQDLGIDTVLIDDASTLPLGYHLLLSALTSVQRKVTMGDKVLSAIAREQWLSEEPWTAHKSHFEHEVEKGTSVIEMVASMESLSLGEVSRTIDWHIHP